MAGMVSADALRVAIEDRAAAIAYADPYREARHDDTVLIAGQGSRGLSDGIGD